jgi:uncharacterized protein YjbJ (UPF0337 family)
LPDSTFHSVYSVTQLIKVNIMNKDQVKGSIKQAAGKVQQKVGEAVGSEKQQAKGIGKQVAGAVQKGIGNAKENR